MFSRFLTRAFLATREEVVIEGRHSTVHWCTDAVGRSAPIHSEVEGNKGVRASYSRILHISIRTIYLFIYLFIYFSLIIYLYH